MPVFLLGNELVFPNPQDADSNGLLALGGDLSAERLLLAYRLGIFPWYSENQPILWFSPDPRLVFFPEKFKPSRSLEKLIKSRKYEVKVDHNFSDVIENCSKIERKFQDGTWITKRMKEAYNKLHSLGYAHSFETYLDGRLAGGLYGVSLGGAFFGESMFYLERDASKVAFGYLVNYCLNNDFDLIDSQVSTDHMIRLGGVEVSRTNYLELLQKSLEKETIKGKWKF